MKAILAIVILYIAGLAATFYAGDSHGRLNVPDTSAGPADYGIHVALPLLGAALAFAGRAVIRLRSHPAISPPSANSRPLKALGNEAGNLISEGRLAEANALLTAAKTMTGTDNGPKKGAP